MTRQAKLLIIPDDFKKKVQGIHELSFDIFELEEAAPNQCLKLVAYEIFNYYKFMDKFNMDPNCVRKVIEKIQTGYTSEINPIRGTRSYHNLHAADVTVTIYQMLRFTNLGEYFNDLQKLALVFVAITHDYLNPDTVECFKEKFNSKFYETRKKELYEKYLIDEVFQLMTKDEADITAGIELSLVFQFETMVRMLVTATNKKMYLYQFDDIKNFLAASLIMPEKPKIMCWLLVCADLSQMAKEWKVFVKWADRVKEKFHRKYEFEKNSEKQEVQGNEIDIVNPSFELFGLLVKRYNSMRVAGNKLI